jgi:all-trans-retinol 13,14-reductase
MSGSKFDAIVIGSGLGGLVAGGLAARSGRRVLVLEKNPTCGGAAGVYRVGELTIESSLHEIDGLDRNDPKLPILERLDVPAGVRFVEVGDLWEVRGPMLGEPFVMPAGLEAGREATAQRFPRHRAAVNEYFDRVAELRNALALAVQHQRDPRWMVRKGLRTLWPFIRQQRLSLARVLESLFGSDEAIKQALCANLIYYADDPDRMWFPHWAVAQGSYHSGGGHYPYGGSKQLADHLVRLIEGRGGHVETGRRVTRILLDGGQVAGVAHEAADGDGNRDVSIERAPLVFGNAAPHVLAEMLPSEVRPRFMAPFAKRPLSVSLWTISLGFARKPRELGVERYSTAVFPGPLRDLAAPAALPTGRSNERSPHYIFVDYSSVDTGLAQKPPYLGTLVGLDRTENWDGLSASESDERRERFMDTMVAALEREYPRLAGQIVQRQLTTARGAANYLGTPTGAIYGFYPERRRQVVDARTRVPGLWLASAFVGLGGYSGAMIGGGWAAKAALQESWRDWAS